MNGILENPTFLLIFRVATPILLFVLSFVVGITWNMGKKILRQMKYTDIRLQAVDHALENTLKNGYKAHRNEKIKEQITEDEFINEKGNPFKV